MAANTNVEVSIKGTWFTVPAMEFDGSIIALKGKWLKMAVIHNEDFLETELHNPELCVKFLKEQRSHGLRADIFTFAQKLPAAIPRFSYPLEWVSVAAARTTSFKAWWEKLPQESRKNVRRAAKRGVTVVVKQLDDDLIRDICDLNNDSPMRQGKRFVHYGKTFDQVKKDQSHLLDRSDYVCAYFGAELIGFLKVAFGGQVASIVQVLPKASHHDKRPANALLARTVELCEAKGAAYLTYGLFKEGNRRDSPLRQFKAHNGFEEMLVPRFYVPLTVRGRLCMKLKLYRGLTGLVPDGVIRFGVSARAKWYSLSQSSGTPV